MASLTGGGLEIQTSVPTYQNYDSNITLQKHQICLVNIKGYYGGEKTCTFAGTCIFFKPFLNGMGGATDGAAGWYTPIGNTFRSYLDTSSGSYKIAVMRIC